MHAWAFPALAHLFTSLSLSSRLLSWRGGRGGDEGDFKFRLRPRRLQDYAGMPVVLNSHTLPLKARRFCLERLLKGVWNSVVTSEAFCSSGMRDGGDQNTAAWVFLFKSFSLGTFTLVSLFRNTSSSRSTRPSGLKEANSQRPFTHTHTHIVYMYVYGGTITRLVSPIFQLSIWIVMTW